MERLLVMLSTVPALGSSAPPRPMPAVVDWAAERERASWMVPAAEVPLPIDSFVVRHSPGKGVGVFATRFIEKGTFCFDYKGVLIRDADYDGQSDYAVGVTNAAGTVRDPGHNLLAADLWMILKHASSFPVATGVRARRRRARALQRCTLHEPCA